MKDHIFASRAVSDDFTRVCSSTRFYQTDGVEYCDCVSLLVASAWRSIEHSAQCWGNCFVLSFMDYRHGLYLLVPFQTSYLVSCQAWVWSTVLLWTFKTNFGPALFWSRGYVCTLRSSSCVWWLPSGSTIHTQPSFFGFGIRRNWRFVVSPVRLCATSVFSSYSHTLVCLIDCLVTCTITLSEYFVFFILFLFFFILWYIFLFIIFPLMCYVTLPLFRRHGNVVPRTWWCLRPNLFSCLMDRALIFMLPVMRMS